MADQKIDHKQIRIDPAVLPRTGGDDKIVDEYAEIRRLDDQTMPHPVVFFDGKKYYLVDGCKRVAADKQIGLKQTVCDVRKGSRDQAIWYACQANLKHGTRMTSAQKRQAIDNCLRDKTLAEHSDSLVAEQCGVTHKTVAARRRALGKFPSGGAKSKRRKRLRKTKTGKVMDTTNIGGKGGQISSAESAISLLPPEPPDLAEDGVGEPVPEWMDDVWADVARIDAYLTSLTAAVVKPVEAIKASESGAGKRFEPKYLAGQLNEIRNHVRDAMPWCVCPECRTADNIRKSCKRCQGRGWLTHPEYDAGYLA
jgi:hypothetical protein